MAGKASTRFIASQNYRRIVYSDANIRAQNEFGVSCIYCHEYFPNIKVTKESHVCRECYSLSKK